MLGVLPHRGSRSALLTLTPRSSACSTGARRRAPLRTRALSDRLRSPAAPAGSRWRTRRRASAGSGSRRAAADGVDILYGRNPVLEALRAGRTALNRGGHRSPVGGASHRILELADAQRHPRRGSTATAPRHDTSRTPSTIRVSPGTFTRARRSPSTPPRRRPRARRCSSCSTRHPGPPERGRDHAQRRGVQCRRHGGAHAITQRRSPPPPSRHPPAPPSTSRW